MLDAIINSISEKVKHINANMLYKYEKNTNEIFYNLQIFCKCTMHNLGGGGGAFLPPENLIECNVFSIFVCWGGGAFLPNFQIKFPFDNMFYILIHCNHISHKTLFFTPSKKTI